MPTPSFDFAVFRPLSWFWLKPLSVNLPMSLISAAVNPLPEPVVVVAAVVVVDAAFLLLPQPASSATATIASGTAIQPARLIDCILTCAPTLRV